MAINAKPRNIKTEIVIRSWVNDQTLDEAINEWLTKKDRETRNKNWSYKIKDIKIIDEDRVLIIY